LTEEMQGCRFSHRSTAHPNVELGNFLTDMMS
jgi:hypothetical protein